MIRYYRWVIMDYQIYIMSENTDTTFIPLRDRDMEFTIVTYLIVVRQGCIRSHDNIHLKLFIKISHLATQKASHVSRRMTSSSCPCSFWWSVTLKENDNINYIALSAPNAGHNILAFSSFKHEKSNLYNICICIFVNYDSGRKCFKMGTLLYQPLHITSTGKF